MFDLLIRSLQEQQFTNLEIIEELRDCCFEAVKMSDEELLSEINRAWIHVSSDWTLSF